MMKIQSEGVNSGGNRKEFLSNGELRHWRRIGELLHDAMRSSGSTS
jgi:hypothetical protein